jgi:hypothetical protein
MEFLLNFLGAWFLCARAQSFLSIKTDSVAFRKTQAGRALVTLKITVAKGKGSFEHKPELEATKGAIKTPRIELPNLESGATFLDLCPVAVFRELKERSTSDTLSNFGAGDAGYRKWYTATRTFFLKSGYDLKAEIDNPERKRFGYTLHSTRVGGVCTLLRAGLSPAIITTLAMWESEMIDHYARVVHLRPSCVEPMRFYNPEQLSECYKAASSAEPARKRRKTKK